MAESAPAPADSQPRLTERGLGRRRLLAIGAGVPVAVAIARASGAPLPHAAAIRASDSHNGTAYYFC